MTWAVVRRLLVALPTFVGITLVSFIGIRLAPGDPVRVVEGPFDPRQGNYAVAGSADYELGLDQRGLTGRLTYGSFNTERLVALFGPPDSGARSYAGVQLYQTDGFGIEALIDRQLVARIDDLGDGDLASA